MSLFSQVSGQDRVDFAKSLAVMLKSGITINEALSSLAEQAKSRYFRAVIFRVRDDIEHGTALSIAFGKEKKIFGLVFIGLIKAGEESGTLEENFQFLAEWLDRDEDLRREISAATLYPKLVFSAAMLLGGSLAVFILPRLVPLFSQLDVELPLITKILLAISLFVQDHWLASLLTFAAIIVGFVFLNRILSVRRIFHLLYLRMPFLGGMLRNYQLALITQLFSTLFKSGLTVNASTHIVGEVVSNIHYRESIEKIQKNIEKGTTLSKSMERYPKLYSKTVINIIAVGEKSGSLANSFEYLSEYYSKEVSTQAKKMPTIIEPMLLILIALVVGFIALSIILPIYKLTGSITR